MKRLLLVLLLLALPVVNAHAAHPTIVGVVTKVEPGMMEVRTDAEEIASVNVDANTIYMMWILQKPWGTGPRTDSDFVRVGKRVHIEVAKNNPSMAHIVWVVVGRVGFE
jgi:hypothetical protein